MDITIGSIAVIAIVLGAGVWWLFRPSITDDKAANSKDNVVKHLESLGYRIKVFKIDNGIYNVTAIKDRKYFKIMLDHDGNIINKVPEDGATFPLF